MHTSLSFPRQTGLAAKANSVQAQVALDDMVWSNKWDTEISRGSILSSQPLSYSILPFIARSLQHYTLEREKRRLKSVNWDAVKKDYDRLFRIAISREQNQTKVNLVIYIFFLAH